MTFPNALRGATEIKSLAAEIEGCITGPLNIMEVCGGHTHGIRRFGLNQLMPRGVRFSHGPGCPVCVMPKERIDQAIALARQDDVILVTFGDMMGVPGSAGSLTRARADGCDVRMVYSPMDSVKIAGENPEKKVVYFAIGFETTAPLTAAVIERVKGEGLDNVFFHINHVLVAPAMDAIMDARDVRVDAFIAPGHVSTITGWAIYREMAERYGTPIVVSGFEPVDILQSVLMIARQIAEGRSEAENQYVRAVTESGNRKARALMDRYFEVRPVFRWRGLGDIPESGLRLKQEFAGLDAESVFHDLLPWEPVDDHKLCICGEVLRGKARPTDCQGFGKACTPKSPVGACMVSSEGACHAYFSYQEI